MHNAPSVTYPVGRSRWAAVLLALAWLAGAAVTVQWTAQPGLALWRLAGAWFALAASGLAAAWKWRSAPRGSLAWNGENWTWTADSTGASGTGDLHVTLDLQQVLLLLWRGAEERRWLWLERAACAERWDDLRRAVYSRARPEALPLGRPPAAKP